MQNQTSREEAFDLELLGFPGLNTGIAAVRLAKVFGISPEVAQGYCERVPMKVKAGAPKDAAQAYVSALVGIGAEVRVTAKPGGETRIYGSGDSPSAAPAPRPDPAPSVAAESAPSGPFGGRPSSPSSDFASAGQVDEHPPSPSGPFGAASGSQPVTSNPFGATSGSQPVTSSSYGATSGSQPATSSSYGATSGSQPATSSSFGATSGSQPATSSSSGSASGSYGAATSGGSPPGAPMPAFEGGDSEAARKLAWIIKLSVAAFGAFLLIIFVVKYIASPSPDEMYSTELERMTEVSTGSSSYAQATARSCDAGSMEACYELGVMYRTGEEWVNRNNDHSLRLLQRACSAGVQAACTAGSAPNPMGF